MRYWFYQSGWRLLPGLLAAGISLLGARTEIFQSFEQGVYCALFELRGEQEWDQRIAVIEIDEASLATIGEFPWPRHYYTDLLEQLTPAQPGVIAFDILFADSSEEDNELAAAMAHHGNVVLATAWDEKTNVIGPNAEVIQGAIATGHIHHQADADGITRTYESRINDTPALSVAAVNRYAQIVPDVTMSLDKSHQSLWLNWRGLAQGAPRYSFDQVVTGQVPAMVFADKIVFVGFTGADLDVMTAPYNQHQPSSGVYQHVVAANNLLAQNHLKPAMVSTVLTSILVSVLLGYWLLHRGLLTYLSSGLLIFCTWFGIVFLAFGYNYWLPTAIPLANILTTYVLVGITKRLQSKFQPLQLLPGTNAIPSHGSLHATLSLEPQIHRSRDPVVRL